METVDQTSLCGPREDLGFSTAHTIWTPFNHELVDKHHSSKQSDVSRPGWLRDLYRDQETTQQVRAVRKICGPQSSGSCLAASMTLLHLQSLIMTMSLFEHDVVVLTCAINGSPRKITMHLTWLVRKRVCNYDRHDLIINHAFG